MWQILTKCESSVGAGCDKFRQTVNKHSRWIWQILTKCESSVGGFDRFRQTVNLPSVDLTDFVIHFIIYDFISERIYDGRNCQSGLRRRCLCWRCCWRLCFVIYDFMSDFMRDFVSDFVNGHLFLSLMISFVILFVNLLIVKVDWGCGVGMWGVCAGGCVLSEF